MVFNVFSWIHCISYLILTLTEWLCVHSNGSKFVYNNTGAGTGAIQIPFIVQNLNKYHSVNIKFPQIHILQFHPRNICTVKYEYNTKFKRENIELSK